MKQLIALKISLQVGFRIFRVDLNDLFSKIIRKNGTCCHALRPWQIFCSVYTLLSHVSFSPSHILFHPYILSPLLFSASHIKKVYKADIRLFCVCVFHLVFIIRTIKEKRSHLPAKTTDFCPKMAYKRTFVSHCISVAVLCLTKTEILFAISMLNLQFGISRLPSVLAKVVKTGFF